MKNNANENNYANSFRINNNKTTTSKYFEYNTTLIGSTPKDNSRLDAEVVVPLKYLSKFWRSLNLPLSNCEIELDLVVSRYCVISKISRTIRAVPNNNPATYEVATIINRGTFQTDNTKLYVSVVTLSINDNIKLLENIKQEFKRTISWNKYNQITTQPKNNSLDYLIDPTFKNMSRLFLRSFKNGKMILQEILLINITY